MAAPTWDTTRNGSRSADVIEEAAEFVARQVVDMTSYHETVNLLLVAGVLVTDQSSAMFYFAVAGRPMVLFTHDF
jgi:CDP-glycerol glycerophosphotransferase